jgi:multimeric flavodoxin WrbA
VKKQARKSIFLYFFTYFHIVFPKVVKKSGSVIEILANPPYFERNGRQLQRICQMLKHRGKVMNVLLINGSPHREGCTCTALNEVATALERNGVGTEILHIGNRAIHGCTACGACAENGYCIFKDDPVNRAIDLARAADGLVVGSPVYYAGPNGALCAFLDRMFFMKSRLYAYKPAAAIVSCRRGGASAAFDRLNKYFTISNMPVVSSQYWNAVHGNTPDEVRQDLEGMQIMRTLGRNMAWLLKCIDAAKDTVPYPEPEAIQRTNFIR